MQAWQGCLARKFQNGFNNSTNTVVVGAFFLHFQFPVAEISPTPHGVPLMVRTVRRYFRVVRLETASIFNVDGCIYIHHESEVYCSRHKSLSSWLNSKPEVMNRVFRPEERDSDPDVVLCPTCRRDEAVCICEIDECGLLWGPFGVGCRRYPGSLPF